MAKSKINDVVKNLLDGMHGISRSDTIVGEPTQVGDATIIPIHRLRVGFMAASVAAGGHAERAEGKTGSRGVGGTAQVDPVAVLAVGADGLPRLLSVDGEPEGTWQSLMREAPELLSRAIHTLADRVTAAAADKPAAEPKPEQIPAQGEPARLREKS